MLSMFPYLCPRASFESFPSRSPHKFPKHVLVNTTNTGDALLALRPVYTSRIDASLIPGTETFLKGRGRGHGRIVDTVDDVHDGDTALVPAELLMEIVERNVFGANIKCIVPGIVPLDVPEFTSKPHQGVKVYELGYVDTMEEEYTEDEDAEPVFSAKTPSGVAVELIDRGVSRERADAVARLLMSVA